MAVFKCKMCGAPLQVKPNESVCTCEYCGSKQTISINDNEKCNNLLNRANTFRLHNQFDLAIDCYSHIVNDFPNEAEAYWGLCLAKFGIEYVDDPRTGLKVPTCHRTLFTSIYDDPDYINAIKYADVIAKQVIEEQTKEIEALQKRIISVSQKEEPFDIFICYKEKDDNNERTKDSVIAQDIYERLIEKGYRVFFSRITLESRLGYEYEPIIFAALRSAKIMLAIGSKPEHFEAVWVKNEWSRYLDFMKDDKNKYLIPCFIDMDAYDLPELLQSLQSQDMSKLGYIQDLLHGVDKILGRNKTQPKKVAKETKNDDNVETYKIRIENALDTKDFDKAKWFIEEYEKVDDGSAKLPMYKLLVKLKYSSLYDLSKSRQLIDDEPLFIEALSKADDEYKETLNHIATTISDRIDAYYFEEAKSYIESKQYDTALDYLDKVKNNKKSHDLQEKILKSRYEDALNHQSYQRLGEAIEIFKELGDYKDSKQKVEKIKEAIYKEAELDFKNHRYEKALANYRFIVDYKDSQSKYDFAKIKDITGTIKTTIVANRKSRKPYPLATLLEPLNKCKDFDEKEEFIKECKELDLKLIKENRKKDFIKICAVVIPFISLAIIYPTVKVIVKVVRENTFYDAVALYNVGKYDEASEKFGSIDLGDSKKLSDICYCFDDMKTNPNYLDSLLKCAKKEVKVMFKFYAEGYDLGTHVRQMDYQDFYSSDQIYINFPKIVGKASATYEVKSWALSSKSCVIKNANNDFYYDDAYVQLQFNGEVGHIQTEK